MKKLIFSATMLSAAWASAQNTGINTTAPQATLDVKAKSENTTADKEGILIPRISKEKALNMTGMEVSTMVYINDLSDGLILPINGTEIKVSRVNEKGFYHWNGTLWERFVSDSYNGEVLGKKIVYSNNDNINFDILNPGENRVLFDEVSSSDPAFAEDASLEGDVNYLYVTPNGSVYVWDPNFVWTDNPGIPNGAYVAGPELGGTSLFYKARTLEDATSSKSESIYRPGRIGVGINTPISEMHVAGRVSATSTILGITVDAARGSEKDDDTIFSTLREAVQYANSITNNGRIFITLFNDVNIDTPLRIEKTMWIQGAASRMLNVKVNLNARIELHPGIQFGIVEGYGLEVNQNVPVAFLAGSNNQIALGGYSGIIWNFRANNQKLTEMSYAALTQNDDIRLSLSRVTFNQNGFTGLGWYNNNATSSGHVNISYWQTSLPKEFSYEKVNQIRSGDLDQNWQNIVGSEIYFSGLDANKQLVERMKINTNGTVQVNNLTGTGDRMVVADANGILKTSTQIVGQATSKWTNDATNQVVKLTNLSDGTTARTDAQNFFIKDNGNVGIGLIPDNRYKLDITGGDVKLRDIIVNGWYRHTTNIPTSIYESSSNLTTQILFNTIWNGANNAYVGKSFDELDTHSARIMYRPSQSIMHFDLTNQTTANNQNISANSLKRILTLNGLEQNVRIGDVSTLSRANNRTLVLENDKGSIGLYKAILPTAGSVMAKIDLGGRYGGLYQTIASISTVSSANAFVDGASATASQVGGSLVFSTANTTDNLVNDQLVPVERVRVTNTGNVGIATTTPTEKLEVAGNIKVTGTGVTITEGGACTNPGTISYSVDSFYGCTPTGWKKLHN